MVFKYKHYLLLQTERLSYPDLELHSMDCICTQYYQGTINSSKVPDQNGHWSHLSDLPSQGALPGCTTLCDTVT